VVAVPDRLRRLARPAVRLVRGRRRQGLRDELGFWDSYLRDCHAEVCDPESWQAAFPAALLPHIQVVAGEGPPPSVLELGSGPVSLLAWGVDQGLIAVTAVDPLADAYAALLDRHGCSYPVRPRRGDGETLSGLFEDGTFDIAYSSNAIDHTASPRRSMEQLARTVRRGGIILCEGFEREGSHEGWWGLHQHDLVAEEGHLVEYGRDQRRTVLTDGLGLDCLQQEVRPFTERSLTTHGHDWPPEEPGDQLRHNWYTLVWRVGG
jgi:SAM-dependent methyltransferase